MNSILFSTNKYLNIEASKIIKKVKIIKKAIINITENNFTIINERYL